MTVKNTFCTIYINSQAYIFGLTNWCMFNRYDLNYLLCWNNLKRWFTTIIDCKHFYDMY